MLTAETTHYEDPEFWSRERYVTDDLERKRLESTCSMVPDDVRSLLDIGCGNGAFLSLLEQQRADLTLSGIERSQMAREMAFCKVPIQQGDIEAIPFADCHFDIVSALEVIEHLPYGTFERGLAEMERVARTYILISVPYREERKRTRCPYCGCVYFTDYHLRAFDDDRMKSLFGRFEMIRSEKIFADVAWFSGIRRKVLNGGLMYFQPHFVCPQCNYTARKVTPDQPSLDRQVDKQPGPGGIAKWLPRSPRPRWIISLYRRKLS